MSIKSLEGMLTPDQRPRIHQRKVFKFYHASAQDPVLEHGSVMLGTLGKFRNIENTALRDELDGQIATRISKLAFESGMPVDALVHPTSPFYQFARSIIGIWKQVYICPMLCVHWKCHYAN